MLFFHELEGCRNGRFQHDGAFGAGSAHVIVGFSHAGKHVKGARVAILGFTFKENCPDVRNTKVIDIYKELKEYDVDITVFDPWASPSVVEQEYGILITNKLPAGKFDACIGAVAHNEFKELDILCLLKDKHVVFDVKCTIDRNIVDGRL